MAINFAETLMELKRRAQLSGRPLSQREIAAATTGWAESAAERNARQRALDISQQNADTTAASLEANKSQFAENLALQKSTTAEQLRLADEASKQGKTGQIISGVGNAALIYGAGKQMGLWGAGSTAPQAANTLAGLKTAQAAPEFFAVNQSLAPSAGAGLEAGAATAPAATTTGAGASSYGSAVAPAAAVLAALAVRGSQGQLDRDYQDRGSFAKFASAPVTGGVPALLDAAGVGDSNYFSKATGSLARAEEQAIGEPLDKLISGDVGGFAKSAISGVVEAPLTVVKGAVGTWLCTATDKHVGLSRAEKKAIAKLRRHAWKSHRQSLAAYVAKGPDLVDAIAKAETEKDFYAELKEEMVVPVVALVAAGELEKAYELYRYVTVRLFREYAPHIDTDVKEG